jgi:hypothetical protein
MTQFGDGEHTADEDIDLPQESAADPESAAE